LPRFLLIHEGQHIHLPEGETLLGRGLGCRVRFNDPAVSREHMRIQVSRGHAVVSNLSSNGTLHNGTRLTEPRQLSDGDEIRIGFRRMQFHVMEEAADAPAFPPSETATEVIEPDEKTSPGEEQAWRLRRDLNLKALAALQEDHEPTSRATLDLPRRELFTPKSLSAIQTHTCPRCQRVVSFFDDTCTGCGYAWPPGHPSKNTQKIVMEAVKQRSEPRYPIEVPVIYASDSLTIDAIVRDVSRGGMFIESELLDPVGTTCEVTALPDGHAALRFSGTVVHVTDKVFRGGVSGLGIRFASGSAEAMRWLDWVVGRFEKAVVD
jgi:pSer/pThr/pTyr-binding forkhead associated (FHA) protein